MHHRFIDHAKKFVTLTDEECERIIPYLTYQSIKKKEHLLKAEQVCSANYFITKGCLRYYFIKEDGTEQVVQFGIEDWWMTDYVSFDRQTPSLFAIQALENTDVIKLEREAMDKLLEVVPKLERYFRIVLQKAYAASQLRIHYIYNLTGEERYIQFSSSFPDFMQRVPQYMLASYLGFTPEFLSRVRSRESRGRRKVGKDRKSGSLKSQKEGKTVQDSKFKI